MAAPTFVGAGAGVTIASGSAACTAAGSGVAVGDLVILQVLQDGTAASAVTYSAISGIANLAGTASSLTVLATDQVCGTLAKQHLRVGRATSTTCSVTVATTGDDLYYRLYVFRGVNSGTTLADILENGTVGTVVNGSGATAAVTDTGVTTIGADRLALQFVAVDDDNPLGSFTGMTGGVWAEAVAEFASATGTDGAIQLQTSEIGVVGDSYGPGSTIVGNQASTQAFGQPFTAAYTGTLASVTFNATDHGGVTPDDLLVAIRTDASGSPSATVIGTTVTINVTGTVDVFAPYIANVNAPITSGTPYWIVFRRSGAPPYNATIYVNLQEGTSAIFGKRYGGTSWVDTGNIGYSLSSSGAAGTINGGSYTMAAADNWGVVGFALIPVPSGPATVTRTVAINATGLIVVVGREELARTAALTAVAAVTAAGIKITPGVSYERSAALAATGSIASVGRELLPRAAVVAATGQVQAAGVRIRVITRTAAVAATGLIATVGREQLSRAAALSATASIATVGRELLARAAAIGATGSIAAAGREQLARLAEFGALARVTASGVVEGPSAVTHSRAAALGATGGIATVGRELLTRTAALDAAATVAVSGRKTVARSAAVGATATVTAAAELEGASQRAAALNASAAVTATPQRVLNRSTTITATTAIVTNSQRRLERTGQLHALALVEVFVGAKFGEASFDAIATITLTRALPPGWIDFPGVGPITQPIGGFGTVYGGGRILTSGHGSLAQPRRGGPPE